MAFTFNFFDWLGNKIDNAKITTLTVTGDDAAQLFFRELALHIAISYIANTLSKCECKVFEGRKEARDELYYALNIAPNPNMNSAQFWNKIVNNYYRNGEALVIQRGRRLYVADGFTIEENPLSHSVFKNVQVEGRTLRDSIRADDALYFRLDSVPVKRLIDGAASAYTKLLTAAMEAYKRDKGRKYKLSMENTKAGDKTFNDEFEKVIKKQLEAFMTHDNAVYPEFKGYTLSDLSPNNSFHANATGEDIFGLRKEIFDITAQAFKIPPAMMYGNITSINDIMNVYLTICIDPLADMFSEELTRKTGNYRSWLNGDYVRVDTSCVRHLDILEVAPNAEKLVSSGVAQVDEVRERIGLPQYNDEFGRTRFITKNFQTAETALAAQDADTGKGGENA